MKKILFAIGSLLTTAIVCNALVLSGSYGPGLNVVTTNRASVYSVTVSASAAATFTLFDSNNTNNTPTSSAAGIWGTNYVAGSFVQMKSYTTNYPTSYVGYNGYTNYYTNVGIFTYSVTNAQTTNVATPIVAGAVGAGQVATYSVDALFAQGIVIQANTNVSVILNYNTGF